MLDDFDLGLEDLDLDMDGIPDSIDPFIDLDMNGISDDVDQFLDLDLNGMPDRLAPESMDLDGNRIADGLQVNMPDLDVDGISDGIDPFLDFNGNGIADSGFYGYLRSINLGHPFGELT
jgi:hypothetical protein